MELKESLSNLIHENRIFFFENHINLETDIPSEKNKIIDLMLQKIEVENMKYNPNKKSTNILVLGPQHSGKSSTINTLGKYFNRRIQVAICDVGRKADVGTVHYEKFHLGSSNGHEYHIFDTAGKPFEKGMDGNDVNQIQKLMHGLPTGVNLSLSEWMNSEIVTENAVGFVFLVVSAEVLTKRR
ncbi:predicted protein [Naegleria gruberi]|uniref:Predicted protein n=1 Tax=Naegleria gruberi TaxID=5762 RepID=D2V6G5_NAEGR|nr:uncharacterized protein NAEGRDRAFT_64427 [Naegleria gruberi]EFC47442.1 predicted protein [Naegleria gruberi]|eukprot:XP_002680186.1 predicted protein [Naegleria gruberi strain NEG-M]